MLNCKENLRLNYNGSNKTEQFGSEQNELLKVTNTCKYNLNQVYCQVHVQSICIGILMHNNERRHGKGKKEKSERY